VYSLVRRFVKTAVGFLLAGLALGEWMMVERELANHVPTPYVVSAHTHAIFVGFLMMLIMGVALWLFPRPVKTDTRYRPQLAEAAYWLVTVGTAGRVAGELGRTRVSEAWLRWAVIGCGALQVAGLTIFFWTMWSRIRAVGSQQREARGERF
jgi:heme/copper-type cytochrome/quinol oxidase subunit 1